LSGYVYLVQDSGELLEMLESQYDSEDRLQELLANYPNLLAGNQINSESPRRWLLVSREMSLPSEDGGYGRWSVDHLFLDQEGIPTIVEVKRSSDTRIRREVIGQMLEYAANAVVYWPVETIQARFEADCGVRGVDPEAALNDFLSGETDAQQFWQAIQTNLQAGRIRMLFVADVIPPELRRLVECLNGQMTPAEVLAVEVRQYTGPQQRVLVPRVIGQTQQAVIRKSAGQASWRSWNESSFFEELESNSGAIIAGVARKMIDWGRHRGLRLSWGTGKTYGSCNLKLDHGGKSIVVYSVMTTGEVMLFLRELRDSSDMYTDSDTLQKLTQALTTIPGVVLPSDQLSAYPTFPISALTDDASLQRFLRIFDDLVSAIRET